MLAPRRPDKGKPAARRGRKAYGPLIERGSRATERRWGYSQEPLRKQPRPTKERGCAYEAHPSVVDGGGPDDGGDGDERCACIRYATP